MLTSPGTHPCYVYSTPCEPSILWMSLRYRVITWCALQSGCILFVFTVCCLGKKIEAKRTLQTRTVEWSPRPSAKCKWKQREIMDLYEASWCLERTTTLVPTNICLTNLVTGLRHLHIWTSWPSRLFMFTAYWSHKPNGTHYGTHYGTCWLDFVCTCRYTNEGFKREYLFNWHFVVHIWCCFPCVMNTIRIQFNSGQLCSLAAIATLVSLLKGTCCQGSHVVFFSAPILLATFTVRAARLRCQLPWGIRSKPRTSSGQVKEILWA